MAGLFDLGNAQSGPLGMLNPGGKTGVTYKTTELDPQTQKLIHDAALRAGASEDDIASRYTAGVQDASNSGMMTPEQIEQQAAGGGTGNSAQMNAIRNKYNQVAQKDIQSLTDKIKLQAPQLKNQQLQQAFSYAQAKQNVAMQNYSNLVSAFNQSQMARAQVLSSVLSLGGSAGGMMMADRQQRPQGRNVGGNNVGSYNSGPQGSGGYGDSYGNSYGRMEQNGGEF